MEIRNQWIEYIKEQKEKLMELLEYKILQRFPCLTLKEVQTTLQLTLLEQTVVGQQLIQRAKEERKGEGIKESREEGIVIGQIQLFKPFQRIQLLKKRVGSKKIYFFFA